MDKGDLLFSLGVLIVVFVLATLIMTIKYNCCMEVKQDSAECLYDVGCNS